VVIRAIPEYVDTSTVTINSTALTKNNSYKTTASLNAGRNLFSLMVYDSNNNTRDYSLYITVGNSTSSNSSKTKSRALTTIETSSQIALYPLDGGSYEGNDTIVLPISPSDLMFTESSDIQTIKLINYGELPVGVNRKLATWSVDSFFPHRATLANNSSKNFKYWFDVSDGTEDPYEHYCKALMDWKNNQTPLVFFFKTWNGYYNCQITKFTYGRKDSVGNVYYTLEFQEYKQYATTTSTTTPTTDYSSDTYYPAEGETILQIAKKLYGSSDYYQYFMTLNSMTTTTIVAGKAYKVR
jgi:hypothetical protein